MNGKETECLKNRTTEKIEAMITRILEEKSQGRVIKIVTLKVSNEKNFE